MNRPSSTITAATLAGGVMTVFWEMLTWLTVLEPPVTLVAASVTLVSGIVGYLKKERVLKLAP